jgi:hypothetical protein
VFPDSFILLVKPKFVLYIPPLCGDRRQGYRFIGVEGAFRLQVFQHFTTRKDGSVSNGRRSGPRRERGSQRRWAMKKKIGKGPSQPNQATGRLKKENFSGEYPTSKLL